MTAACRRQETFRTLTEDPRLAGRSASGEEPRGRAIVHHLGGVKDVGHHRQQEKFDPGRADADLQRVADEVAQRLDLVALEYERGWQGRITQDHGIRLSRVLRGVEEIRTLDGAVLRSGEARKLSEVSRESRTVYVDPARLARKDREQLIHGPTELLSAILEEGAKGQQMQRYKGLGEMNPNQLWETTLDPEARTLLQVKIGDLAEADDIFTKLMGDVVEPRREFIQANALSVENLDF
jgi:DNA gyrase subunit B